MTASARLINEFYDLQSDPELNVSVNLSGNNYYKWEGTLYGPSDSYFEGGTFRFEINFPASYPCSPPQFYFKTPIYHPNIGGFGTVFNQILNSGWSPRCTPKFLIRYIIALLNEPNPSNDYGKADFF